MPSYRPVAEGFACIPRRQSRQHLSHRANLLRSQLRRSEHGWGRGDWREWMSRVEAVNHVISNAWVDGEFVAPSGRVTEKMLAEIKERNAQFFGYANNSVKTLKKIAASSEEMRSTFSEFARQAEKLRDTKPDNPIEANETWLWDFLEAERQKRRSDDLDQ